MPGNSRNVSKRTTAKKGAAGGSGGKNRASLKGRGKTLPADERPWHKGYSGTEKLPETYLIDKQGNVRQYVINKRQWDSSQAVACIKSLLD